MSNRKSTIHKINHAEIGIRNLSKALKRDPQYWITWQANLAMAFKDQAHWDKRKWNKHELHETANNAAKCFLDLLIRQ